MNQLQTLCMVRKGDKLLLGMKKRGFGAGRWNGFGGKVQDGETVEQAAARELQEEIYIKAVKLNSCGVLNFSWNYRPLQLEVHIFDVINYEGEPMETEEMKPEWFNIAEIPFGQMWSDDPYWIPLYLNSKNFVGNVHFNEQDKIISHDIHEIVTAENQHRQELYGSNKPGAEAKGIR